VRAVWIKINPQITAAAFEVSSACNSHRAERGDVWDGNTRAIEFASQETMVEADVMAG
jgi:hypothetical protein